MGFISEVGYSAVTPHTAESRGSGAAGLTGNVVYVVSDYYPWVYPFPRLHCDR